MYTYCNQQILEMIYYILRMTESRGYIYVGTNRENIISDREKIKNACNKEEECKVPDYTYTIKNKFYFLFEKSGKHSVVFFLHSVDNSTKISTDKITRFITYHPYYSTSDKYILIVPDDNTYEKLYKKFGHSDRELIEIIPYQNINYDPTDNVYYQNHEKIKNTSKKHKKFGLKLQELSSNDVICRWKDYKVGDTIKINKRDGNIQIKNVK